MGGALTRMLGAGVAYFLSKLNPVFNHSRELETATGLHVLGEVSLTSLESYRRAIRVGLLRYSAVAGALLLTFAVFFVMQAKGLLVT